MARAACRFERRTKMSREVASRLLLRDSTEACIVREVHMTWNGMGGVVND